MNMYINMHMNMNIKIYSLVVDIQKIKNMYLCHLVKKFFQLLLGFISFFLTPT